MQVARAIATHLKAIGIERVYGVPGEDHLLLLDALEPCGITYVPAQHETAACIMAGADAQLTGRPGVVLITLAPGLTNAINGIANAYLDRIPMLIFTGQHGADRRPIMVRQTLDNHRVVQGVVKESMTIGGYVHQALAKAIDIAMADPAGPVYVDLPDEIAGREAIDMMEPWLGGMWTTPDEPTDSRSLRLGLPDVTEVQGRLRSARRPVMILGGFHYSERERERIARFLDTFNVVALTTSSAKGSVVDTHPRLAGVFYNSNLERRIFEQADVLITLNLDAKDILNRPWPYSAYTIAINRSHVPQRFYPAAIELVGDIAPVLAALDGDAGAGAKGALSSWTDDDVAEFRASIEATFEASTDPQAGITVVDAIRCIRSLVPADTIVTVDAGFGKPVLAVLWPNTTAETFFASHGLSTMAYAIPSANAIKALVGRRTVLAFMGDGSLMMGVGGDRSRRRCGLAPIYIVWMEDP